MQAFLRQKDVQRYLPIWVGPFEAESITAAGPYNSSSENEIAGFLYSIGRNGPLPELSP